MDAPRWFWQLLPWVSHNGGGVRKNSLTPPYMGVPNVIQLHPSFKSRTDITQLQYRTTLVLIAPLQNHTHLNYTAFAHEPTPAMDSEITEFITFTLKNPDSHPSASFESVTTSLAAVPGVLALHHGSRIEDPSIHLLIVRWSSHDAFSAFSATESYTPWLADLKAFATNLSFYQARLSPSAAPVLDAPCTEVLVAHGIEKPTFPENLATFSSNMSEGGRAGSMKGWHANAHGEVTTKISSEADGEVADAAVLLVGWDSKDDHEAAKAVPGRE